MASIVGAAVAFAIAGAAVNVGVKFIPGLGGNGAEYARHNRAMEDLTREQQEWIRERQLKLDKLNQRLSDIRQTDIKFNSLDKAMAEYKQVMGGTPIDIRDFMMEKPYPHTFSLANVATAATIASAGVYLWATL